MKVLMKSKRAGRSLLALLLGLVFALNVGTPAGRAQSGPTGTLSGTVTDPTGAVIPGASVTVTHIATNVDRTTKTDSEGHWKIPVLPVGIYKIVVEAAAFKKGNVSGIEVEASVPRNVDISLEAGAIGESVDIVVATDVVQRETAATFRQLNAEELTKVPTSTRSFTHLLSAEAGVSSDLPPVLTNGNGNISPSVNGTRTTSTSLSFNGIDATNITSNEGSLSNNIAPAPETLSEVKLQTSLYDASTGRSGGGNFQLITRSGGNKFNGSLYHYLQNEKLNANDFFFNRDSIDRPKARRNEGGFTVGGPVVKEKFFFFGGYQYTRAKTGFVPTASSQTVLPEALSLISGQRTAANIVAAFRQLNQARTGFLGFSLTEAQISPIALAILNLRNPATGDFFIPAPKPVGAGGERVAADANIGDPARNNMLQGDFRGGNPMIRQRNVFPAEFEQDQFTTKLDHQISQSNRLSGAFFFANFPGFDPFPDPSSLASPVTLQRGDRNRTLALSDTIIISPTLINEARFGYFFLNNTRSLSDAFLEFRIKIFGSRTRPLVS